MVALKTQDQNILKLSVKIIIWWMLRVSMMGLNVCKYNAHTALLPSSCCARVWVYHSSQTQSSCFVLSLEHLKQSSQSPPAQRGSGGKKHATRAEQEQANTNKGWLDKTDAILSVWRMVRALVMEFLCPVLECLMKNHMMSMSSAQQLGDHQSLLRMIQIPRMPTAAMWL